MAAIDPHLLKLKLYKSNTVLLTIHFRKQALRNKLEKGCKQIYHEKSFTLRKRFTIREDGHMGILLSDEVIKKRDLSYFPGNGYGSWELELVVNKYQLRPKVGL